MRLTQSIYFMPFFVVGGCYQVLGLGDYRVSEGAGGSVGGASSTSNSTASTAGAGGRSGCTPGGVSKCYSGPPQTQGIGNCADGTHLCLQDGVSLSNCIGETLPVAEDCSKKGDEDCDGFSCSETVWANGYGDPNVQAARVVAVDPDGNIYVAGNLKGTITFGGQTLTAAGLTDIFLAKLDPKGKPLWAKSFGGGGTAYPYGLAADLSGVVLLGSYGVYKFDPLGQLSWSHNLGPSGGNFTLPILGDVALDSSGNVLIGLTASGSVDCGGGPLAGGTSTDIICCKLDAAGNHVWSHRYFGSAGAGVTGVAVDYADDVLFTGYIQSPTDFGGSILPASDGDPVLFKLKADGTSILWKHSFPGAGFSLGYRVAVDGQGAAVVIGGVGGPLVLSGLKTLDSSGGDMFIASFNASGTYVWSRQIGATAIPDQLLGVSIDSQGFAIVAGYITGPANFGSGLLQPAGGTDGVLAAFDAGGKPVWSRVYGGAAGELITGVAQKPNRQIVAVGSFASASVDFGTGPLANAGASDAFVFEVDP